MQKPLWYVKLSQFEYWDWWLFYLPLLPYYAYLSIKCRSFSFFTNVNPAFDYGGFFETEKNQILSKIPDHYVPKTLFVAKLTNSNIVFDAIQKKGLDYPLIAKPNIGERGTNVSKINNKEQLLKYLKNDFDFLIQEYVPYALELAILYYRYPNEAKGHVSSVTAKEFLQVKGDGKSTIFALMQQNDRARFQIERLKSSGLPMDRIPQKGETVVLEPIGNHCRGTMFINYNHLINPALDDIFDSIAQQIKGFYYGRFDLKAASEEDLMAGKNIKIMELNGVNSDAAHIFDPSYKLWQAYKDVAQHWKILAEISQIQTNNGLKPISFFKLVNLFKSHFVK